ncbi:MAG TPA: hypothetical protein VIF43_01250 [Patescibacteria group bacterium]|jgi:hypothetical protein
MRLVLRVCVAWSAVVVGSAFPALLAEVAGKDVDYVALGLHYVDRLPLLVALYVVLAVIVPWGDHLTRQDALSSP